MYSPVPKICLTYPTMMKLGTVIPYLKKIQKIYESHDTSLSSADVSIFLLEISKVCYIKKYRYRLHFDTEFLTILTFLESSEVALINMVKILMMSAKMATPGLLKMKVFWNKGYNVITSVHDVTNKILSRDSNCILDSVMWSKFRNSSTREVNIISIL